MIKQLLLAITLAAAAVAEQPNIIFVLADDLGYMDLVSYASRVKGVDRDACYYETPNLDKLANQGVRFTNGYASCSVCSPTRASLQTGKYPARACYQKREIGRHGFRSRPD